MTARDTAAAVLANSAQLLADLKAEDIAQSEARQIHHVVMESIGWLLSVKTELEGGVF